MSWTGRIKQLGAQAQEIGAEFNYLLSDHSPWFITSSDPEWFPDQIPVFTYHCVDRNGFADELRFLAENGYRAIGLDAFHRFLIDGEKRFQREILLTFDDGYSSIWTDGAPLLKQYGFHAVAFVIPGYTGRSGYLDWEQIKRMHGSGLFDIQSHTMSHNISVCSTGTDLLALEYELSESKRHIENHLHGHRVEHLCYPRGIGCHSAIEMSRRLGYKTNFWGAHIRRALNKPGDDPYTIVRLKHDYICRLPGLGRRRLLSVLSSKALRRFRGKAFEF